MNIRDLSALERAATWIDELIQACRKYGQIHCKHPKLTAQVTRRAQSLRSKLRSLRECLDNAKGGRDDA
jgi:hypothetical protein